MKPLGIYNFDFSISLLNVVGISKVPVSGTDVPNYYVCLIFFFLETGRNYKLNKGSNDSQKKVHWTSSVTIKPLFWDQMYCFSTFFFFQKDKKT